MSRRVDLEPTSDSLPCKNTASPSMHLVEIEGSFQPYSGLDDSNFFYYDSVQLISEN